jgi:hypothetical protein
MDQKNHLDTVVILWLILKEELFLAPGVIKQGTSGNY